MILLKDIIHLINITRIEICYLKNGLGIKLFDGYTSEIEIFKPYLLDCRVQQLYSGHKTKEKDDVMQDYDYIEIQIEKPK